VTRFLKEKVYGMREPDDAYGVLIALRFPYFFSHQWWRWYRDSFSDVENLPEPFNNDTFLPATSPSSAAVYCHKWW
jgi:hypothetical protein